MKGAPRRSGIGRRLAVIHQGTLGDFLLTLPVLEGFHETDPEVCIDLWCRSEFGSLLAGKPYLRSVHSSDGSALTPFYHDQLWEKAVLPASLSEADTLFLFGQASSKVLADRLARRCRGSVHWIQSFPEPDVHQSVVEFLADQLRPLGWPCCSGIPRIDPPQPEKQTVRRWIKKHGGENGGKPIFIHPGSGGLKKVWPLKRWWSLLGWLFRIKAGPVIVITGPADAALREFPQAARRWGCHHLEQPSLVRLAAFLGESRFYCGNDSGASHLAAVVGAPSIVIFGPTNPEVWAPRGSHVRIFQDHWKEEEVLDWSETTIPSDPPSALTDLILQIP